MKILLLFFSSLLLVCGAGAVSLISTDGRTRDFPVVVSAAREGLIVRDSPAGKDIVVPWERIDLRSTKSANPWLAEAQAKAAAGQTVPLNIGLKPGEAAKPQPQPPTTGDWTILRSTIEGSGTFTSLALTAYVHREVKKPRLAIVWVGSASPLGSREDAADFARRMSGALVLAHFSGNYFEAATGSGQALVKGLTDLFSEKSGDKVKSGATPAIIVLGQGEAGSFAWSLVCARPQEVLAAVTIDGRHVSKPNAGAFATPVLFLQTTGPAELSLHLAENLERPFDLWRHYSTDGSRWCFGKVAPPADPLTVAMSFCRETAALSPYQEVVALWEDYQNDELKNRIPLPTRSIKEYNERGALLGTLRAAQTFPLKARKGAARNDLIWLPSATFARMLAR